MQEYYPTPSEVLKSLGTECVLVGSCTQRPIEHCKDVDFVISDKGLELLRKWAFWLAWENSDWAILISLDDRFKTLEFFNGLCNIEDKQKFAGRLTYEQAIEKSLCVKEIYGVEVLSL